MIPGIFAELPRGLRELPEEQYLRAKDQQTMVKIPEGQRFLGSSEPMHHASEKPMLYARTRAFYLDETEISAGRYRDCVTQGECESAPLLNRKDGYPATGITFHQARKYCQWVGGDLPTEAQWETAARGELSTLYPFGATLPDSLGELIWDRKEPVLVNEGAQREGFGLLHMSDNVSEWTLDQARLDDYGRLLARHLSEEEFKDRRSEDPADLDDAAELGTLRGGSYATRFVGLLRATLRRELKRDEAREWLGFRCAIPEP